MIKKIRMFFHRCPHFLPFSACRIDKERKMCYISYEKSSDEDTRSGNASQRETHFGGRALCAYRFDTTSEPPVGNSRSGAPVTVPMSGEAIRNQGGTVEYFCIPPLITSGGGYFLYLSPWLPLEGKLAQAAFRNRL